MRSVLVVAAVVLNFCGRSDLARADAIPQPTPIAERSGRVADPVARLAAAIDARLSARWSAEKVSPASLADDCEYLRRTFLNIAGRIPTPSEVQSFLEDPAADKRRRVVNRLLSTAAYPTHFADVLASAMLPEVSIDPQLQFQASPFDQWLRRRLADGVGYDGLVRELLTSPVAPAVPSPAAYPVASAGPSFYFQAKGNKPENIAAGVARTFLGVRIECAQCHNHPFAKWRREQFWQLAAFFAGIQGEPGERRAARDEPRVSKLAIPDTSKVVQARFLDGVEPDCRSGPAPRAVLADWMTADANSWFARASVNRIWAHFFATGIVDPIDDFDEANPPSHPELLDDLAKEFVHQKYDVKFLIRAICASHAYQLSSVQSDPGQSNRRLFARAPVKGLTAVELTTNLMQAVGEFDSDSPDMRAFALRGQSGTGVRALIAQAFNNDQGEPVDREATILQALALMNSSTVDESTSPEKGKTLAALIDAPFLDTAGRIEMLFLATLSRRPTPAETERLTKYVDGGGTRSASKSNVKNIFDDLITTDKAKSLTDRKAALGDVLWALLNSSEFLTNH